MTVLLLATTTVLPPAGLNTRLYLDANDLARRSGWAHTFMHAWANWAGLVAPVLLAVLAYRSARRRPAPAPAVAIVALTGAAAVIALGLNQVVGHAAGEIRPYWTHPSVLVLASKANDYAFPSDHATVAGALALGLMWYSRRFGVPAVVLAVFLAFSRVYVGSHYPGDVVAGLLLGAVIATLCILAFRKPVTAIATWSMSTPLALVVTNRWQRHSLDGDGALGSH